MAGNATLTMVTSMPTTSRLMQQIARMRFGWVSFFPASAPVAAFMPEGDTVEVLSDGKGAPGVLDAATAKRIPQSRQDSPNEIPFWLASRRPRGRRRRHELRGLWEACRLPC